MTIYISRFAHFYLSLCCQIVFPLFVFGSKSVCTCDLCVAETNILILLIILIRVSKPYGQLEAPNP